ncbi:nitrilase family protein [Homoserinimonas sp. OAct 916]|uniref:nitrilase family protein n=1 Tax=Homoserinimonas sp. OAct 916 TaxID=2211450 RepID=UPI0018E52071|nr:nitrilase family protein [Homoserinimonas sp. OAct 916]
MESPATSTTDTTDTAITANAKTTVACCQLALAVGDIAGNRAKARAAIIEAADVGAKVIVLPELCNTGYMFTDLDELRPAAETVDGPTVTEWAELARERDLIIVGGFVEAGDDGNVYNAAVAVDASGVLAKYRKAHLWNFEKNKFTPGSETPPVVDTAVGRIGIAICYDLEFPEWMRLLALAGTQLLCSPVNWPEYPRPDGERPSEIVKVQANATSNRMFIAAADRVGTERGQDWVGGSVIVDADGFPVTQIRLGAEMIAYASLDLTDALEKQISENNNVQTDRRPELYGGVAEAPPVSA